MADLNDFYSVVGRPTFSGSSPEAWGTVEASLGLTFPQDFKRLCDAFGPGLFNDYFRLAHPLGSDGWSLGNLVRLRSDAFLDDPEEDFNFPFYQALYHRLRRPPMIHAGCSLRCWTTPVGSQMTPSRNGSGGQGLVEPRGGGASRSGIM